MDIDSLTVALNNFQIILLCGLPGTGKSYLMRKFSKQMIFVSHSTDEIRTKELYPEMSRFDKGEVDEEEYRTKYRKKVYEELVRRALEEIGNERRVVLDGLFLDEMRDLVISKLLEITDSVAVVIVRSSEDTIQLRIKSEDYSSWKKVYNKWICYLKDGTASYPVESEKVKVYEYQNG